MLKRPPPNFVKRVLRLQTHQKRSGSDKTTTSLQLFSEACSKWARKRAVQLAAEDEYEAYQIFMAELRGQQQYDHEGDDLYSGEEDDEYYEEGDFDFCTESDFVNDIYDYKHDHTEDETEFDDSDAFDCVIAVDKNGNAMDQYSEEDPFAGENGDLLTPAY